MARPDWWEGAACRGMGTHIFFGLDDDESVAQRRKRERQAKQICRKCPVTVECLAEALKFADDGVRGGLTRYERQQIAPTVVQHGEWVLIANSAGLSARSRLERRAPVADDLPATFRVVKGERVVKQTHDETEAWIALHNSDL